MSTTDQINQLQGHVAPEIPTSGRATRLWVADVVTVNPDGTVDVQPVQSRATKIGVPVPGAYKPAVGDRVFVADLNGDPRVPIVLGALTTTTPTVTGSRGANVALASLLTKLDSLGLINDNTTA